MENYFMITRTEDGFFVQKFSKKDLLIELDEERDYEEPLNFLKDIPDELDIDRWPTGRIIIKGEIIIPKPVKIVEEYEID